MNFISGHGITTAGAHGYSYDNVIQIPSNAIYIRLTRYQSTSYGDYQFELALPSDDDLISSIGVNKQANPFFETFDTYNTNYDPDIVKEVVFSTAIDGGGGATRRIPTCIITNSNTMLAACEVRSSTADNSQTGIILARKSGGTWSYNNILPYDPDTYGKCMNPSFVIDRTGAHGTNGRIFLFFLAFPITANNNGYARDASTAEMDCCYIYSDDDGVTWSAMTSIKSAWSADWVWVGSSPSNGGQMTDGTLVIPCMGRFSNKWYSGVLYKKTSGTWTFSEKSLMGADNESAIFVGKDEKVYLNCRNENNGHTRNLYTLDFGTNKLAKVTYDYDPNLICQQSIAKGVINGTTCFMQSACDPYSYNTRNRVTVWISADGLVWQRLIRVEDATTYGYSVVDVYSNRAAVIYEDQGTITFVDLYNALSVARTTIARSLAQTMEQRMQLLLERYI